VAKLNLSWLRNLFIPFIIIVVLFVAFGAYYLYWVPNRQRHLDDRGFRYLKTLSEQIRLTINTYDKMMDHAVQAGVSNDALPDYLRLTAPQLTVPEKSEIKHAIGEDKNSFGDPPKIDVQVDEGKHFLYLAFAFEKDTDRRVLRTDLDALINGLLGPDTLSPFDVVLVARSDGSVIFQKSLSGVEMAKINNLEDASGAAESKNQMKIDAETLSQVSRLEEVRIAGARYRLYSQPLEIGFRPIHPTAGGDRAEASWVLCGMVRADRFRSESQLIPYSYILTMLAVILLAVASYPFLKLYLSLPGERLRARDVAITAVFTCFIAAVFTFIFADIYFWTSSFATDSQADMTKLAHAINANFQREQQAAFVALGALDGRLASQQNAESKNKASHPKHTGNVRLLIGKDHNYRCDPQAACRADILAAVDLSGILQNYPYLFFAFWSDDEGNQQVKWTTRRHATPFIPLDETSAPYYPAVRTALAYSEESSTIPGCGIGPLYSPTTGQNIIVFWGIVPLSKAKCGVNLSSNEGSAALAGTKERSWAAIVTQPVSVYNAVLPGGYQFAVLQKDGTVVFHSDTTRNLRENFLAETDLDPNLQSRVEMRSEGPVTANYMGQPHRMYVLPMDAGDQEGRWTIVIFRDLHMEEVMNLEILSLVSILFIIYAVATIVLVLIANWIWGIHSGRRWFWPDSRLSGIYQHVALVNALAVILLVVLSPFVPGLALLICATLIPAAVLVFNIAMAGRRNSEAARTPIEEVDPQGWQSMYFAAAATLVLVIAVLPCVSLFKVAANFEHRLLVENTILKLANDLQNRAQAMRDLYRGMNLGLHRAELLAGPEKQLAGDLEGEKVAQPGAEPPKPVYSYHQLLSTTVSTSHELIQDVPDPSAAENSLLSFLSYPYNKRAADDRYLAEGKSDVWRWTSSSSGSERTLELTQEEPDGQVRNIKAVWRPFVYPWGKVVWWLGVVGLVAIVYALARISLSRIFQLERGSPTQLLDSDPWFNPASLISDLPMNLLLIGQETSRPIVELFHRSDVQVHEAETLLQADAPATQPSTLAGSAIDAMISDGRPLVLRNFERLPDDPEKLAKATAAIVRLLTSLGNSVILVSSLDPVLVPSIETNDRWRDLLHSFVRIDLSATPPRRLGEDDADYQNRISAESYFHWLFAGLPKINKLVMLQLAQEKVVNPNSGEVVDELVEQGMVERKWGLLSVKDEGFAKFLKHALPHLTVRNWERQIAGTRPFSLQTSLLIVGVGVVAFLLYTQGEVFNTWVTYATGVASAVPKALQFFENFRSKATATAAS